jgi:hypothetical protein
MTRCFICVYVDLGFVTIVIISAATLYHWIGVNSSYVFLDFDEFLSCTVHRQVGFKQSASVSMAPNDYSAICTKIVEPFCVCVRTGGFRGRWLTK